MERCLALHVLAALARLRSKVLTRGLRPSTKGVIMSESNQERTEEVEAEWKRSTVKWLEEMDPYYRDFIHGHILRLKLIEAANRNIE